MAMTIVLFLLFGALVGGNTWFVFFRKKEPDFLTAAYPAEALTPAPARTPSPSVGRDIGARLAPPAAAVGKPQALPVVAAGPKARPAKKQPQRVSIADGSEAPGGKVKAVLVRERAR
jgi:hypothetical protein